MPPTAIRTLPSSLLLKGSRTFSLCLRNVYPSPAVFSTSFRKNDDLIYLNRADAIRSMSSEFKKVAETVAKPAETPQEEEKKLIFAPTAETFKAGSLDIADLSPSPITQFHAWFSDAQKGTTQPEACTLSTASLPSGSISSRIVYLKELTPTGFVIFSNFQTSRKAVDLASNPQASLLWWWKEVERQVRVEGPTERISKKESQEYFNTRARGSRIGAWASRQSQPIADRSVLENWVKEETERWEGKEVEVPEWWGGLRIKPLRIEFWQGRESRLHDRFVYSRESVDSDEWKVERLSP